jgi:hypothetical protein
MNALPYTKPAVVPKAGVLDPAQQLTVFPAPYAVWRRGDFLALETVGDIVNPNPNGSIAAVIPTELPIISSTASAGAPAVQLFAFYTYIGAGSIESQPSPEFILNVAQGTEATVEIPAANAPAAATDFALYVGQVIGGEWQQVASTALGSAATVPYPLTNYQGATRGTTNMNSLIIGMAESDWDVTYAPRAGGPGPGYSNREFFGFDASNSGGNQEQYQGYYYPLSNRQIEISLVQAWWPALEQQTAGLLYSTQYGCFAADTSQSNKVLTIVGKVSGANNPNYGGAVGGNGDTGARIIVQFNSGLLAGN